MAVCPFAIICPLVRPLNRGAMVEPGVVFVALRPVTVKFCPVARS